MKFTIKYFASVREAMGISSEDVVCEAATAGALRDWLIAKGAPYVHALARGQSVRLAVNHALCDETQALESGAEVAFFPPVTGG